MTDKQVVNVVNKKETNNNSCFVDKFCCDILMTMLKVEKR